MRLILLSSFALSTFCPLTVAQTFSLSTFGPKVGVTVQNTPEKDTIVSIRNNHSVPITAAVIQMQRFFADGGVFFDWTRYIDSLITEPNPILPNSVTTLDFGRQTIANAPLDRVVGKLILFEDGTWIGDQAILKHVLNRRRVSRDAIVKLIALGNQFNERNTGLAEALRVAKEFSDEQLLSHADPDERSALVTAVGSFAGNLQVNFKPGKAVFTAGIKSYYETEEAKLTTGKPSI